MLGQLHGAPVDSKASHTLNEGPAFSTKLRPVGRCRTFCTTPLVPEPTMPTGLKSVTKMVRGCAKDSVVVPKQYQSISAQRAQAQAHTGLRAVWASGERHLEAVVSKGRLSLLRRGPLSKPT